MEAGAADLVRLDEGNAQAQLSAAQRGGVAARAGAQDDQVVHGVCHENSSLMLSARAERLGTLVIVAPGRDP